MNHHCVCGRVCKGEENWNPDFELCGDCSKHRYDEMKVNSYLASFQNGDLFWLYDELCILKDKGEVWWELINIEGNEKEVWCPYATRTFRDLMNTLRHSDDR
jgi:hypothetical protein